MPTERTAPATPHVHRRLGGRSLRWRLTLLSAVLLTLIGGLLLFLAYLLVGQVVARVPQLPPGTAVVVGDSGTVMDASEVTKAVTDQARETVLVVGGLIAFPVQVLAGAVLAWVLIGRALRPLSTLTRTARGLSESSLDRRVNLGGPRDEVAELADTFDDMTARLQAAFEAERRFVANASHELRTPLAVIRTEIDVTLADPAADVEDLRRMGEIVREATDQADRLLGSLLILARTQARGLGPIENVDLATLVDPAVASVATEWQAKELRLTVDGSPTPVRGDPALLGRLVGNLIENAVRHNVQSGWITISTSVEGDRGVLQVASSGPVIEPDKVVQLFEPFRQGARARTTRTGTGLGLSIVRAVVSAHAGTVTAVAVPDGGLSVRVTLPLASTPSNVSPRLPGIRLTDPGR
ncbi:sensor histidine kinase [Nakamurella silvestris]|nr:sensor histidine kinase [Nakamurella silvestris]